MSAALPSDDDMLAAWHQLRRRDWPTLEEIKRAALLYQLVRGQALRKGKPVQTHAAAEATRSSCSRTVQLPHHPPMFDHKRAAAGDRDD